MHARPSFPESWDLRCADILTCCAAVGKSVYFPVAQGTTVQ